jgi:nicotinamide-nucleotide amidase
MTDEVLPRLQQRFKTPSITHRTVFTIGAGESMIAERLKEFEAGLPDTVRLAYLPHFGTVRLRLTETGEGRDIDGLFATLCTLVQDITVVTEDLGMEAYIGRLLLDKGKTVATAESCTGGMLAEQLTSIPGSSRYFLGSIVSNATPVKESLLAVDASRGVVNEAVVKQRARGVLAQIPADYAIATSGIMGPEGGTEETPVGTVWVAVGNKALVNAKVFHFRYDRGLNTQLATLNALNLLRLFILEN